MRVLLFQMYGANRRYHLELTYSILSAHRFLQQDPADIRIALIADEPNLRPDLPADQIPVSAETIHRWQLDGTYKHGMQLNALRHALQHYATPVALLDTDTVLRDHPARMFDRISPGHTLMHIREGRMSELREWPQINQIATALGGRACRIPLTADTVMYNVGVLGLHPADLALVDRAITATSEMRAHSDLFTCNQIATSMVCANESRLSTCEDVVEHYWGGDRAYYHYQIDRMFPGVLKGGGIASVDAPLPPLQDLPRPGFRHRLRGRLRSIQRGSPPAYAHAVACASTALALRSTDPDLANVWAETAASVLAYGLPDGPRARPADFAAFAPDRLPTQSWLRDDFRRRWIQYWSGEIGPPLV